MSKSIDLTNLTPLELQEYNQIPRYQTETPVATVMRYLKSWWTPAHEPDSTTLIEKNIDTDPLNSRQKTLESQRHKFTEVVDKTLSFRTTSDKLGITGTEPVDVLIGVVDGEFTYEISHKHLRPVAKGEGVQALFGTGLVAASTASYALTGQGVLTKALTTALFTTILPQIGKIKYVPQIVTPIVAAAATFGLTKLIENNVFVQFSFVVGMGLCAIMYKRGGKALATGGWDNFKKYVIPIGVTETGMKSILQRVESSDPHVQYSQKHQLVERISLKPQENAPLTTQATLSLELTVYDQDMYYAFVIGGGENEIKFPPVKMASKGDDDDDDDDDNKVKTKKESVEGSSKPEKKAVTSSVITNIKKTALIIGSGVLTAASMYFTGQGLTTTASNAIFTASVKAECRTMPLVNGYGVLLLASGAALAVKIIYPDSFIGDLYFMPLSTMISMAVKDYKDRIVTGKLPKNTDLISVPVVVQRLALRLGWTPAPAPESTYPMAQVLGENNNDKVNIKIEAQKISPANPDEKIPTKLKISARSLTGVYDINKQKQAELHLGRLKAKKLDGKYEAAFLISSVGLTLLSSFLTKQSSISEMENTIQAQNQGEGVITAIFNSVIATYLKQFGKKLPPIPRDGGLLLTSIGAIAIERYLISIDSLPMLFSSIVTTCFLAIQSKKAKQWVFGKPYGKTEGWITTKHPSNKEIGAQWKALKNKASSCFTCRQDQVAEKLTTIDDDSTLLVKQGSAPGQVEILVLPSDTLTLEQ